MACRDGGTEIASATAGTKQTVHERAELFAARHFRWNYGILIFDACAFWAGLAFFDSTTVLPLLLSKLGASTSLIGLTRLIQTLGFTLPALFGAHHVHGRTYHKSFLCTLCGIARLGLLTLPVTLLLWGASAHARMLAWFFVVYAIYWSVDGACVVSWFDIVAKAIPPRVRGRFFGTMQMLTGVATMGVGYAVAAILDPRGLPFPQNVALLAVFWCVGAGLSQIALMLIREPPSVANVTDTGEDAEKPPLRTYLRLAPSLLHRHPRVARLIVTRLVIEGASMAAPFYILFAQNRLHVGVGMAGLYLAFQSMGSIGLGPLWGWISDRFGPTIGLRAIALTVALIPSLALIAGRGAVETFPVVFFLIGGTQQGIWMVASSLLLESVDASERPLAIGVVSIFQTPIALYGPLGGLLVQTISYSTVFGTALVFALCGLILALRFPRLAGR